MENQEQDLTQALFPPESGGENNDTIKAEKDSQVDIPDRTLQIDPESSVDTVLAEVGTILESHAPKQRRGRKPGRKAGQSKDKDTEASGIGEVIFDTDSCGPLLTDMYLGIVGMFIPYPVICPVDKRKPLQDSLVYCANKYIPGSWLEHMVLIGLGMLTVDIVRISRYEYFKQLPQTPDEKSESSVDSSANKKKSGLFNRGK